MSKDYTSFLGVPVTGEILRQDHKRAYQRPIEELQPLLEAVLADPFIVEVGWEQYTPYFNDGDVCVFRVREPWVKTVKDGDGGADRWNLTMYSHPTLSVAGAGPEVMASKKRAAAFCNAIENGEFEDVLFQAFGDHAKVVVTKTGINVEFYQHE
jgi:hypothetical protein